MIRELRVEGWRAFDRLTLQLDAGVTLSVADNGIGKTSLIEAAGWGLYGSLSGVDAGAARRFGQDPLRVEVDRGAARRSSGHGGTHAARPHRNAACRRR